MMVQETQNFRSFLITLPGRKTKCLHCSLDTHWSKKCPSRVSKGKPLSAPAKRPEPDPVPVTEDATATTAPGTEGAFTFVPIQQQELLKKTSTPKRTAPKTVINSPKKVKRDIKKTSAASENEQDDLEEITSQEHLNIEPSKEEDIHTSISNDSITKSEPQKVD
jgi:hypothetical protein